LAKIDMRRTGFIWEIDVIINKFRAVSPSMKDSPLSVNFYCRSGPCGAIPDIKAAKLKMT